MATTSKETAKDSAAPAQSTEAPQVTQPAKSFGPSLLQMPEATSAAGGAPERARVAGSVQRAFGNARLGRMLGRGLQAKLTVGSPDDPLEREADRVAERASRPVPPPAAAPVPVQRKPADANAGAGEGDGGIESRVHALRGRGEPLSPNVRSGFEQQLGRDFSDVRVHTGPQADEAARSIGARAFTAGSDIAFAEGQFAPDTGEGRKLLAHELTHVAQQNGAPETVRRDNGGAAPAPAPASPAPAPGVNPPAPPAPAPAPAGAPPPAPVPAGPPGAPAPAAPPATTPSEATEIILPPVKLFDANEEKKELFDLPILNLPLFFEVIPAPPPLFAFTASILAKVGLKGELFLRYGPAFLQNIRLVLDPSVNRYSGTAQLYVPVSAGPRLILTGSLVGSVDWLGLVETLAIEGGLRATGQAPIILAASPAINVIYDKGSFTFTARPEVEAGVALLFDLDAFAEARVLGDKIWEKKWNLYHWQWGRAVRMGTAISIDYAGGKLGPVRNEPFAERISIDELLQGMKGPAEGGGVAVVGPDKRPVPDRLKDLLGTAGTDPNLILATLAQASDGEKKALLADKATVESLQKAVGPALWPTAERILKNAPSETVPSLDEGTVFLADRHIRASRFQDALHAVVSKLQSRGIINGSLCTISYVRETAKGEGLTTTKFKTDPTTGRLIPDAPPRVSIYDPAFVNVPLLYSVIMHEYLHVLQFQGGFTPAEFADPDRTHKLEVESYLWEIEHARGTGLLTSRAQMGVLAKRLTDHYNALKPASQAPYRARYEAAIKLANDAATGVLPVNLTFTVGEARRVVQESARKIAAILNDPSIPPALADREIARIQAERAEMLVEVVLADNPLVEIVDRKKGIYRYPVTDAQGRVTHIFGGISVVWNLSQVSPSVYTIGARIGSRAAPGSPEPRMGIGGSTIQGRVQPFPADLDFVEEIDIIAKDEMSAGYAMADIVIDFVRRTKTDRDLEFISMGLFFGTKKRFPGRVERRWSEAMILNPANRDMLARSLTLVGGGNINTFWRARLEDGRFIDLTKVINLRAVSSVTGKDLFKTRTFSEFQVGYLDQPDQIPSANLGEYARQMMGEARKNAKAGNWLKASKRAFNYFMAIGNLEAMQAIQPVFASEQADANRHVTVVEAIERSLSPATPTRILRADEARSLLEAAAVNIGGLPPAVGAKPPGDIAAGLRTVAGKLAGDSAGILLPDAALNSDLQGSKKDSKDLINKGIEITARDVIVKYIGL